MATSQKKTLVNAETDRSVPEFLDGIAHKQRQSDARVMVDLIQSVTGKEPKIWGKSIVAFGKYSYQRKNGEEYEWFNVGFSPGKAHTTVYLMFDIEQEQDLLHRLGPHKHGRGCLYIKKLEDVNLDVLKEMVMKSDRWQVGS